MIQIPSKFIDAVVAIGERNNKDEIFWIGTGFLFGKFLTNDNGIPKYSVYLVTNKHVLSGKRSIVLRFNPKSQEKATDYEFFLIDGDKILWTGHPKENIDVAVTSVDCKQLSAQDMLWSFFESDTHVLTRQELKKSKISEGDSIFILGFPMNLVHKYRQYVIVRGGVIARITPFLDENSNDILIDSFVFPGNSGGPVITKPILMFDNDKVTIREPKIIGMVSGNISYKDIAISPQTLETRVTFVENSGLTVIIPMDFIMETVNHAESAPPKLPPAPQ